LTNLKEVLKARTQEVQHEHIVDTLHSKVMYPGHTSYIDIKKKLKKNRKVIESRAQTTPNKGEVANVYWPSADMSCTHL